jgi:hypothetical protein
VTKSEENYDFVIKEFEEKKNQFLTMTKIFFKPAVNIKKITDCLSH